MARAYDSLTWEQSFRKAWAISRPLFFVMFFIPPFICWVLNLPSQLWGAVECVAVFWFVFHLGLETLVYRDAETPSQKKERELRMRDALNAKYGSEGPL